MTHLEDLLRASIEIAQHKKTIDVQRTQIEKMGTEIDLLNARLRFLELKLAREAEMNSDITMPLLDSMFFKRQAG